MQRLTGAERQKRIELTRDAALRLVRRQHNIEIDGELQRVWERDKIVFSLEWLDGEQLRSSYRPGEWGRVMRECLKTPSGMRV
jgi:hypothetical protein